MSLKRPYFNIRHPSDGPYYFIDILWADGQVETALGIFPSPEVAARCVNQIRDSWTRDRLREQR